MTMVAKFRGTCRQCGQPIRKGADIEWTRQFGAAHAACVSAEQQSDDYSPLRGYRYSTAAMLEDERTYEASYSDSFRAGL